MAACLALLAGCGGERRFEAEEFVEELNANGATVELGERLLSTAEDVETHAVSVGADAPGETHAGGGSVRITEDSATGLAEYERCERAASLLCFRAANAVLILEDELAADDRARVEQAIAALAAD